MNLDLFEEYFKKEDNSISVKRALTDRSYKKNIRKITKKIM